MKASLLTVESITAGYESTTILEDISLELRQGERLGILGRNGAGKTTLLSTILGLTKVTSGRVFLDDRDLKNTTTEGRIRRGLGCVPQTRDIFSSLTVEENLLSGIYSGNRSKIEEAYQLFPRLKERYKNLGNQLSGGEQQMLSIARSLMGSPSLLMLDEPLEGLSPLVAKEVMEAIQKLSSNSSLGCILVEQHVSVVLDFATRILILERGRPAFYGSVEELKLKPEILESCIGLKKIN